VGSVVALSASAPSASAAVTIGSMEQQGLSISCGSPQGRVQLTPPAGETYTAPSDGVITSFAFPGPGLPPPGQTKLLVLEPVGGTDYRVMAAGQFETSAGFINTRATRLPISAGQTIGAYGFTCVASPASPGMTGRFMGAEPPVGATQSFPNLDPGRMLLQATIEPDCDGDGLGDETQDTDLTPCPPAPTATITKAPPDKVKTKKKGVNVTVEFAANEPGVAFNCVLDGRQEFKACTSPLSFQVKKGQHTFSVTAIDAGDNAGPAATDTFKVKRKKKKKRR
jgi:hypothetical protein